MKAFLDWLYKIIVGWCAFFMTMMAIAVMTSVFLRYVLGITFVWAEEAITMLFVATTYFGTIIGVRDNEHIRIDFFVELLPQKAQKVLDMIGTLMVILVQVVVIRESFVWIEAAGNFLNPALRIPNKYFYSLIPLSSALILLYELGELLLFFFPQKSDSPGKVGANAEIYSKEDGCGEY